LDYKLSPKPKIRGMDLRHNQMDGSGGSFKERKFHHRHRRNHPERTRPSKWEHGTESRSGIEPWKILRVTMYNEDRGLRGGDASRGLASQDQLDKGLLSVVIYLAEMSPLCDPLTPCHPERSAARNLITMNMMGAE
jgi:hypothetical protein